MIYNLISSGTLIFEHNIRDYSGHKAQYYLPPSAVSPADVQTDYDEEHAAAADEVDNQNRLHLRFHRRAAGGNGSGRNS